MLIFVIHLPSVSAVFLILKNISFKIIDCSDFCHIPLKSTFVQLQCKLAIGTTSVVIQRISRQCIYCLLFVITYTHQSHNDRHCSRRSSNLLISTFGVFKIAEQTLFLSLMILSNTLVVLY